MYTAVLLLPGDWPVSPMKYASSVCLGSKVLETLASEWVATTSHDCIPSRYPSLPLHLQVLPLGKPLEAQV